MQQTALYRSRTDRMLGGVCAGLGDHFDLDPTVVRLLAVLLLLIGNVAAVLVYLIMWIVVPEEPKYDSERGKSMSEKSHSRTADFPGPDSPPPPPPSGTGTRPLASGRTSPSSETQIAPPLPRSPAPVPPESTSRTSVWVGVALVFVGVVLLVQMFFPALRLWEFWPVTVIIAGLLMIFRRRR